MKTLDIVIVVVLLFFFGALMYYIGYQRGTGQLAAYFQALKVSATPAISPTTSPLPSAAVSNLSSTITSGAAQATLSYYNAYIACIRERAQACSYKNYQYIDAQLIRNIQLNQATGDPIVCAQTAPSGLRIDRVTNDKPGTATVQLVELFGSTERQLSVDLRLSGRQWKITNIVCPGA